MLIAMPSRTPRSTPPVDFATREEKIEQSRRGARHSVARRLTNQDIEAIWAEIQARHRDGLGWKAPEPADTSDDA